MIIRHSSLVEIAHRKIVLASGTVRKSSGPHGGLLSTEPSRHRGLHAVSTAFADHRGGRSHLFRLLVPSRAECHEVKNVEEKGALEGCQGHLGSIQSDVAWQLGRKVT